MSIPNCVPQSPTWLILRTSCPSNSRILQIDSPMMVDLRWPTWRFLATFGEEKSTAIFYFFWFGGITIPYLRKMLIYSSMNWSVREICMKPFSVIASFFMRLSGLNEFTTFFPRSLADLISWHSFWKYFLFWLNIWRQDGVTYSTSSSA